MPKGFTIDVDPTTHSASSRNQGATVKCPSCNRKTHSVKRNSHYWLGKPATSRTIIRIEQTHQITHTQLEQWAKRRTVHPTCYWCACPLKRPGI